MLDGSEDENALFYFSKVLECFVNVPESGPTLELLIMSFFVYVLTTIYAERGDLEILLAHRSIYWLHTQYCRCCFVASLLRIIPSALILSCSNNAYSKWLKIFQRCFVCVYFAKDVLCITSPLDPLAKWVWFTIGNFGDLAVPDWTDARMYGCTDVRRSWRPSVGFIEFALDSFNADCPHKRII